MLPPRWRLAATSVVVVGALGVAALGWWYADGRAAGPLDSVIDDRLISRGEGYEHLLWPLADLGSPPALVLGMVILVVAAVRTHRRPAIVLAALGPPLASLVTELALKPLVGRTHFGGLSLPSGHATSITAQVTVYLLAFAAVGLPRRALLRRALIVAAPLVVLGVSGAMVSLERHYATDTVAGAMVGASVVCALALALDAWNRARSARAARVPLSGQAGRG
ncbi:phosphatase PAP2 family protein [Pseudonocardia sp.]|uniref:phosphatase PAP2 family protein n=1 Tax=Pseudonocardia sp. TaxID=60912 RepID=UPI002F40E8E2